MKNVALLLSVLFLFGCGSTGSESGSALGTSSGGNNSSMLMTSFNLSLQDSSAKTAGKQVVGPTTTATYARVVVRQFNTVPHSDLIYDGPPDEEGFPTVSNPPKYNNYNTYDETYRRVGDVAINNNVITFLTPVSIGSEVYEFDVVTYAPVTVNSKNVNMMIKSGTVNNVSVSAGGNATVILNDLSGTVDITPPLGSSIKSESYFNIKVSSISNNPFRRNFDLVAATASNKTVTATGNYGSALRLLAPTSSVSTDTSLNLSVTSYIADAMLDTTNSADKYTNFVYIFTDSEPFAPLASVTIP